jgi:serine protease Do
MSTALFNTSEILDGALTGLATRLKPSVVQVRRRSGGNGAGVIWTSGGKIVTNHHVVAGAGRGGLVVEQPNGQSHEARVLASNPALDLALLQIDAQNLPAAPVGDSRGLRVGELVIAVGHPWGQRDVVTAGIVSGVGVLEAARGGWRAQYIRSDVRLAPGNSGGPLLNARGQVIGINAMIFGGDLSVAIPSHVATEWVAAGVAGRAFLGIGVQGVELPAALRVGPYAEQARALVVAGVAAKGPAANAGLLVGDLLLAIDSTALSEPDELLATLAGRRPGERVTLHLARGGTLVQVEVTLASRE